MNDEMSDFSSLNSESDENEKKNARNKSIETISERDSENDNDD